MTAALPLRIFVIRHGQTAWTVSGQYTGTTDILLSPKGKLEAQYLRQSLRKYTFTSTFCSPLRRARQTCTLAGLATHAIVREDLTEWNNGCDEGLTPAQIQFARPGWRFFRDGPDGGESLEQIEHRADRCLADFARLQGNVAVFSHAHFCRVLAARWIHFPVSDAQHFLLDTASFGILSYEHNDPEMTAITLWNSAALDRRI
ncbi:histidine phosphatase family protein [Undibacterium sp. Dicai25W]|uniref:histidine phosphatase family protein n=1 Tax=Undibacterium sp. Dicai25W TaxID=3413034 RepID=UPI003BF44C9F